MEALDFLRINSYCWIAWSIYWAALSRSVNKTAMREPLYLRASHVFCLVLACVLIFSPRWLGLSPHRLANELWNGVLGVLITASGLLFAVWARNHLGRYWSGTITLKEGHKLIRTGPYRLARHPIYTGFIAGALGSAITAGSAEAGVGFLVLLGSLFAKMRREEALLTKQFGGDYLAFKREVKMLVPGIF